MICCKSSPTFCLILRCLRSAPTLLQHGIKFMTPSIPASSSHLRTHVHMVLALARSYWSSSKMQKRKYSRKSDLTWQALMCRVSRHSILHSSMSSIPGVLQTVIRYVEGSSLGHTPAQQSTTQATGMSTSGRPPEGEMNRSHMDASKVTALPVECVNLPSCVCASAAELSICLNISDEL